jgi:hypothetical protein
MTTHSTPTVLGTPPTVPDHARAALDELLAQVRAEPGALRRLFPAVARRVGRGPLDPGDLEGVVGPTLEDAARGHLLRTALECAAPQDRVPLLQCLYEEGDADERRAVVRALGYSDVGEGAVHLVHDALRTNDVRLVGAAMGPYAATHLDESAWRQGVLKCLFTGVPLAAVADLWRRRDAELDRMVRAYAEERRAAGRSVPHDVQKLLAGAEPG